ncbi:MAG TPA: hypothetical protein VMU61_17570 [Candidatus Aquilonibacter sp.]|nr:hypothetical protein [Candidatus Aquilonibacter sp.]
MRQTTLLVICALMAGLLATTAMAAITPPPADTLKIDYFSNANTAGAPDGTLRITNPGTSGGSLYAAFYVFDPNQELTECCTCVLTPDGLRTLSVNADLTSNPLTGVALTTGVIKIVSTTGPSPARLYPTAAVRAWTTHIQNSNFSETETASQDATFSAAEQGRLQVECNAIILDGSGHGVCSCGTGE